MRHDKLEDALSHIDDAYIAEAADQKKSSKLPIFAIASAAAAVAAILLAAKLLPAPGTRANPVATADTSPSIAGPTEPALHLSYLAAAPEYPNMSPYPVSEDGSDYEAWRSSQKEQYDQPDGYADSLDSFFSRSIPVLLSGKDGENQVCSPINIYMALSMLAETTGGDSRQQILDLLNADSAEALRTQAGHVWNAHYCDDGATKCLLANSLWLDQAYRYDPNTAATLASRYYASVFHGDLGSAAMDQALQSWLNENTGGLLKEQASQLTLPEETAVALASAVYFQAKWTDTFSESQNTEDIFHAPSGDMTCTFMNRTLIYGPYYCGKDYSATSLSLESGDRMLLILPDEGYTPQDILTSGHALQDLLFSGSDNAAHIKVNLSVPKFDVTADRELSESLQKLGVTDVFTAESADFSPILPENAAFLDQVNHAARVKIDEEGVEAAAYTVMVMCGAGMPPAEEVDLVLDRPFLFVIVSRDDLPLFAGVVNQP